VKATLNGLLFRLGAGGYDLLTGQDHWREQILAMLDHVEEAQTGPQRVLDLGCGPGVSAFALAGVLPRGSEVVGVDLSPQMIALAKRHHRERFAHLDNVALVEADAAALPFAADRFDVVTGHSFLYLVPDQVGVLREARRVLRPGGTLVFMEPSRDGSLVRAARGVPHPVAALARSPLAAGRFATSMALWRVASAVAGRMSPALVASLFAQAGFDEVRSFETLGGLGLHVVAR
jgi:ubiquinone/menaquinone biosynthesis C-methylase UbiE